MKNLPEHVAKSVGGRKLIRNDEGVLVAVSGGLDSMVLLHLLNELAPRFGWKLFVAHFNHQLRGRASDTDERFVRNTAGLLGLPFKAGRGAAKALAKKRGLSVEMAARELRHEFLAKTALQLRCKVIAVAHHADDQVELFFLRLLRGAGTEGLAGMKWCSISPASKRRRIVRPLLDLPKVTLEEFARESGIRFREDASNVSLDILRNRVRHELLPLLRHRFQPALNRTILRLMDVVGADAEVVMLSAKAWLEREPDSRRFSTLSTGVQRRVMQLQLQEQKVEAGFDLIESLRCASFQPVTVRPGVRVMRDAAGRILRVATANKSFRKKRALVRLVGEAGKFEFAGTEIIWRRVAERGASLPAAEAGRQIFDADKVGSRIVLRHWRPGDRFQPIGMKSPVKLQDWFVNQKIPTRRRRELLLATTSRGEIFWIEGLRIGELFKLSSGTRRRLIWRWQRPE